ncbi:microfibril-associated glycoprotein 4-like isoform X1 [Crassostrea angulata]|uniref:microfibril-associated glycoprotein 4-like isoform X1 n=1 Tax=Magallana angulata TaxID=2784310 RepID=UPI0022B11B60|nr:microfibril-associated glycoprotein 4-like isoform X1 [Crassostrea angulata]
MDLYMQVCFLLTIFSQGFAGKEINPVLSHLALSSKYWSQKLSKAADGSTILTTSYRFPSSMTLDKQPTPDNYKLVQSGLVPVDCSDVHRVWPRAPSGVYRIYPGGGQGHSVYCDMTLDGGGWTVFLRRMDGSEKFNRKWEEYQRGFGNVSAEHWLGNQILHEITVHRLYELRVNLEDFAGNKRFAKYSHFRIGNEADGYRLTLSGYTGNAGDSLDTARGQKFSTYDKDQDSSSANCAMSGKGGWWHNACFNALLTGVYYKNTSNVPKFKGVTWFSWKGIYYSLKSATMMLRKHQMKRSN